MTDVFAIPEDRRRSPHTGWTRAHWIAQADRLLSGLMPYASPSGARICLPGRASSSGPDSDALEGFARSFLLAAFRIAADRGEGPAAAELIDRYASGLAAGADPGHPEVWPFIAPGGPTQPMVEAASIALALHETRAWLWDRLPGRTRELVAGWLGGFVGNRTWANNWMLFQTVVEEFLASVGAQHSEPEILRGLDALERWYVGDGWYSDGDGRSFDYYTGWALHFYPLMWTRIAAAGPRAALAAERLERYRARLRLFLSTYPGFIGADGVPVHQGRSLIYRTATAAPLWLGELFDCAPYEPGLSRRAASGILKYFAGHGAPDRRGLLTLGWHGEHLPMVQDYSGPASPYWAAKGFLGLLLPADHRAWTAAETPLPVERGDFQAAIPAVGWVLSGTRRDGIVRLLNHGSDNARPHGAAPKDDPNYAPFAFSTSSSPDTGPDVRERRVGNHLALVSPAGEVTARGVITPTGAAECVPGTGGEGAWAASRHTPALPTGPDGSLVSVEGAAVTSYTFVRGEVEMRMHCVTAPAGWTVREGGYPACEGLESTIEGSVGWTGSGEEVAKGASAYGEVSRTPYLTAVHPGGTCTYIAKVVLRGAP